MSRSIPEIQQIPARHGTATFVPKGHVIKITNTYGRQVVDTWAFALPEPPSQEEIDEQNEQEHQVQPSEAEQSRAEQSTATQKIEHDEKQKQDAEVDKQSAVKEQEESSAQGTRGDEEQASAERPQSQSDVSNKHSDNQSEAQKTAGSETETDAEKSQNLEGSSSKAGWSWYIPSMSRSRAKDPNSQDQDTSKQDDMRKEDRQPKTWSQYLSSGSTDAEQKKKTSKGGQQRTWASYFPSGKSFSNYVPQNVSISGFASSHLRDPTKSYAEQLYDFSKTPVGAGALSAATGSGYAGSAYAAYQAYLRQQVNSQQGPPMEYLSMSHTHSATSHLIPKLNDTLVSNLRRPILTVIEDTAAVHDTVIAACDPQRYRELGVKNWEEHGSCAENLVLALKEINESAGLKGYKAVGADVTVNTVPQPLNLFMNIPFNEEGSLMFEAPKGKKGEYIRLRAERDVIVVMSACPQDVLPINGGKCMAAHFVVQEPQKDKSAARRPTTAKRASSNANKKATRSAQASEGPPTRKPQPTKQPTPSETGSEKATKRPSNPEAGLASTKRSKQENPTVSRTSSTQASNTSSMMTRKPQPAPKAGRAPPKKLERRTISQAGNA